MIAEPQFPDEKFTLGKRWDRLAQIYHAFKDLGETEFLYNADSITPALKELAKLTEKF